MAAVTNLQWFKFFGLDARRDRFTGRLSGGLAEDVARVTCLSTALMEATRCISGKQVEAGRRLSPCKSFWRRLQYSRDGMNKMKI